MPSRVRPPASRSCPVRWGSAPRCSVGWLWWSATPPASRAGRPGWRASGPPPVFVRPARAGRTAGWWVRPRDDADGCDRPGIAAVRPAQRPRPVHPAVRFRRRGAATPAMGAASIAGGRWGVHIGRWGRAGPGGIAGWPAAAGQRADAVRQPPGPRQRLAQQVFDLSRGAPQLVPGPPGQRVVHGGIEAEQQLLAFAHRARPPPTGRACPR